MTRIFVGFLLILFSFSSTSAQSFVEIGALGLADVANGSVKWGDFDNDSDLDILLTGNNNSGSTAKVYRNNGNNTFTDINAALTGVNYSSAAWGDYDNDGDLDILLTGTTSASAYISKIYKNNGNSTFTDINAILVGVNDGSVAWGDYDNDGDLDILLTGANGMTYHSKVYKNNGNDTFTDISASLVAVSSSSVAWGDYDNDGDLDVLLTGGTNPGAVSKIYRNDGSNTFTDLTTAALTGVSDGSVAWGDYDNDGDLDILLTGYNGSISPYYHSKIYRNNSGTSFTDIIAGLIGVNSSAASWGDYDNDGDLDILLTGYNSNISPYIYGKLYRNNSGTSFTDITTTLPGVYSSSVAWGDFDNDKDLDILLTGNTASSPVSKLFRNDASTANQLPGPPAGLNNPPNTSPVTLTWSPGIDVGTPVAALGYNIYLRTSYNEFFVSPMTKSLTDGKRLVLEQGNAGQRKIKTITLPSGTYYWSVQTLDQQGGASPWAAEKTFTIGDGTRPAPVISDLSTTFGNPGETLIINGDYFSPNSADNLVKVGTYQATVKEASKFRLVCTLPQGTPGSYQVSVKVATKTATFTDYNFILWGENQWKISPQSVTTKNLTSVFVATSKIAYAVGMDGTLLRTGDAGTTWASVSTATIGLTSLSSVYFTDATTGYVAGAGGKIFKTLNSGALWTAQTSGTTNDLKGLFFTSATNGWAVGKSGTLLKTVNGGTNWTPVSTGQTVDFNQLIFEGSNGWIACSGGVVMSTINDGANWTATGLGSTNWSSISKSGASMYVVSASSQSYYYSTTAGAGWNAAASQLPSPGLNFSGYLIPENIMYGVGKTGLLGKFDNTTGAFSPLSPALTTEELNHMHSISSLGFAVGNSGSILVYKPFIKTFSSPFIQTVDPEKVFPYSSVFTLYGAGLTTIEKVRLAGVEVSIIEPRTDFNITVNTANLREEKVYAVEIKISGQDAWVSTGKSLNITRFRRKDVSFPNIDNSAAAWADYDKDGDLDLAIAGYNTSVFQFSTKIYRNNGNGNFTDIGAALTGVRYGSVDWGDYDGDGDPDILLTGSSVSGHISKIYRNDNGSFVDINANLAGVYFGSAVWGDYDRDGDLDVLITGTIQSGGNISKVYKNNNNTTFTDIDAGLTAISTGTGTWGDYDNDGDLDILLIGSGISKIYSFNGTSFIDINAGLAGFFDVAAAWGDHDNDGDLDVLISNSNGARIYRNTGNNTFLLDDSRTFPGINNSQCAWVDFDNDGDLDITLSGNEAAVKKTYLYVNEGSVYKSFNSEVITGKSDPSLAWGDYDNDGDLDLFLGDNISAELYENLTNPIIATPAVPVPQISATVKYAKINVVWTIPDAAPAGTTFNLVAGRTSGASDILPPVPLSTGTFTLPRRGNAGTTKSRTFTISQAGDYFFKVQAISTTLNVSAFSSEFKLTVTSADLTAAPPSFTELTTLGIAGLVNSASAWGDYDKDGDLDVLITGYNDTSPYYYAQIYQNTNGVFTDINAGLAGVRYGAVAWGDYDNDGDLDVLLAGYNSNLANASKVYKNNGNNTFTDINAALASIAGFSTSCAVVAWGDYDNDGDLDILLSGAGITKIYNNNKTLFTEVTTPVTNIENSSAAWGDYDNDGDLDILIAGNISSANVSKVFRNNGNGVFSDTNTDLIGIKNGVAKWIDYDNDGNLDIFLSGTTTNSRITKIYRNQENSFVSLSSSTSLTWVQNSSAAWGDYNNDGLSDLAILGNTTTSGGQTSKVYTNYPAGTFTEVTNSFAGAANGSVNWGDYDNDGDLDLLLTGSNSVKIYINQAPSKANTLPAKPSGLTSTVAGNSVSLTWARGTDDETVDGKGLEYNVYVIGEFNELITSPMTKSITDGKRLLAEQGNAGLLTTKKLILPSGTYRWAVQTLDRQGGASAWSDEKIIVVGDGNRTAPVITDVSNAYGTPGETFTITGDYFAPQANDNTVIIGDYPVIVTEASRYKLTCTIPNGSPGTYTLSVKVGESTTPYALDKFVLWGEFKWTVSVQPAITANLNAVFCSSPREAFAVGAGGAIYKTENKGETWTAKSAAAITTTLNTVFFTTPATGWVAGIGGKIFKTTDGGTSWTPQVSGTTNEILSIYFTTANAGWASGKSGTLLKTFDGGTTWTPVAIYIGDINQVIFDGLFGRAVGSGGTTLSTTDGGTNWSTNTLGSSDWHSVSAATSAAYLVSKTSLSYSNYLNGISRSLPPGVSLNFTTLIKGTFTHYAIGKNGAMGVLSTDNFTPVTTLVPTQDLNSMHSISSWSVAVGNSGTLLVYKPAPKVFNVPFIQSVSPGFAFPAPAYLTLTGAGFSGIESIKFNDIEMEIESAGRTDYNLRIKTQNLTIENDYVIYTKKSGENLVSSGKTFAMRRFKKRTINLPANGDGSVAWGDYNNDGYLDILSSSGGSGGKIFRNNKDGTFTDMNVSLLGNANNSVAWGDYDNDSDLDILLYAYDGGGITKVYRNTNGAFADIGANLFGISDGTVAWGDYNNDGYLDILMTGYNQAGNTGYSKIYKNNKNGSFTEIAAGIDPSTAGSAAWGDYDNDGDLDILLEGWNNSKLYRNEPLGTFTKISAPLQGIEYGNGVWGDYDNDGDLDILLSGISGGVNGTNISKIYTNNNGTFSELAAGLTGLTKSEVSWVDIDNDDDLDVYMSGIPQGNTSASAYLYQNNSGTFTKINTEFPGFINGSSSWGDFDNDGDLDLLSIGAPCTSGCTSVNALFENVTTTPTNVVTAPTLSSGLANGKIVLTWTVPENTPKGTTYNLRVGKTPGGKDILSPSAIPSSGKLTVPQRGNMGFLKTWSYTPEAGTYYFSVQAVSPSFRASAFSTEVSTTLEKTDLSVSVINSSLVTVNSIIGNEMDVKLDYTLTITNSGFIPAQNVSIKTYLSTDNTYDVTDKLLATDAIDKADGISSQKKNLTSTLTLAPGNYFVIVVIDPVTGEENSSNNAIAIPLDIPLNDVKIKIEHAAVWSIRKPSVPVKIDITHIGVQPSVNQKTIKVFRSADEIKSDDDLLLYSAPVDRTLKNEVFSINRDLDLKAPLEYRTDFLIAEISTADDSNPTNNSYASALAIARADLEIKDVVLPADIYQDQTSVPISFVIRNTGASIDWLSTTPSFEIYYTSTPDASLGKISLKKFQFGKLDYLGEEPITVAISLSDGIKQGQGYFWVSADADKLTDDNSFSNNLASISRIVKLSTTSPKLLLSSKALTYTDGTSLSVSLGIDDIVKIKSYTIYYRGFKKPLNEKKIAVTKADDLSVSIEINPKDEDDLQGVYVWAEAENTSGKKASSNVLAFNLIRKDMLTFSIKGGVKVSDYQIISFPRKRTTDALATLSTALGPQNKSLGIGEIQNWRMYAYDAEGYKAYDNNFTAQIGAGYFLISKEAKEVEIESGESISQHKLVLNKSWTLIGNPFDFELDWKQARASVAALSDLYVFRDGVFSQQTRLKPMEGAFVFNSSVAGDAVELALNSFHTSSRQSDMVEKNDVWKINFSVSKGDLTNSVSSVGMLHDEAENRLDPAMPHFIEFVDLVSEDFKINSYDAASVFVPVDTTYVWNYVVKSNIGLSTTTLRWSLQTLPEGRELFLYDKEKEQIVNMREMNSYSFESGSLHRVSLYYGSMAFIQENLIPKTVVIGHITPNPHRGMADLTVSVPDNKEGGYLNCEVYDLMGRRIYNATYAVKPGFNSVHLEGLPSNDSMVLLKSTFIHSGVHYLSVQKIKSH